MSVKLSASLFRIPCNQASRDNAGDLLRGTGQSIRIWKNSTAVLQGAIFVGDPGTAANLVTDLSNVTAVVLAMRVGGPTGALLFAEQTVAAGALNAGLTYDQWAAGTAQHFQFALTADQTNVAAQSGVWMVLGVNTSDAGAFPIAINNNVAIVDPGINNPGDVNPPTVYTGWSKQEADARYLVVGSAALLLPTITGAAGGGAATDLSSVDVADFDPYARVQIREHVTNPGVGITGWILETSDQALDGARECAATNSSASLVGGPARVWRNRF